MSKPNYTHRKFLKKIVAIMTKDGRKKGFSTMDIYDAAKELGINIKRQVKLGSVDEDIIKLSAIRKVNPKIEKIKDTLHTYGWHPLAIKKVFSK